MSRLQIKIGDRWTILGATGSGKTVFSRQLLSTLANATRGVVPIYILDSKLAGDFKLFEKKDTGWVFQGDRIPSPILDTKGRPYVIWQPETDDIDRYDAWLSAIFTQHKKYKVPCVIYFDELGSITNAAGNKFPLAYDKIQKQGRGLDIGCISVTQSPSFIPSNTLRQTSHIVRMHLNDEYDIKKITKIMGKKAEEAPDHDYGFWYRNCTKPLKKQPAIYYKDMQEFFGIS